MKTLPRVASEMALHVLAYNLTRVMNIMDIQPSSGRGEGLLPAKGKVFRDYFLQCMSPLVMWWTAPVLGIEVP
jgi:hypothetical protein